MQECNTIVWELTEDPAKVGYNIEEYFEWEERVQQASILLTKQTSQSSEPISTDCSPIRLPKITLPSFDGDYMRWTQFHDLYVQLIHSQNISKAQKMFYLTGSLSGDARSLIQHLPVSESNYDTAWDILRSRYENKRLLCTSLLNKFLAQSNLQHESAVALKSLHDTTRECILGLNNLGISTESWDPLLVHLIIKKFDKGTHTLYEQSLESPRDLPTLNSLLKFLEVRFQALEALGREKHPSSHDRTVPRSNIKNSKISAFMSTTKVDTCAMCKKNHPLFSCKEFLNQSPNNRCNVVKKNNLCFNCMKEGHSVIRCPSRNNCSKCSKRHNTLLHVDAGAKLNKGDQPSWSSGPLSSANRKQVVSQPRQASMASQPTKEMAQTVSVPENPISLAARTNESKSSYVLLGTVVIELRNHEGKTIQCRAILDSGSQLNFMTEKLAKELGLKQTAEVMYINGIGEQSQRAQHRVTVRLHSRINNYATRLEAFILPNITTYQPERTIDTRSWPIPNNIPLADPEFNRPGRIEFLIGAEIYYDLMSIGQIKLGPNLPTLQNTVFGWVVTGAIRGETSAQAMCGICSEDERTEQLLERFWNLEEMDSAEETSNLTVAEQRCVNHFDQHVRRTSDGRFIVKLPFANDPKALGESEDIALRRFLSLERKLCKNPEMKSQYVDFMNEYIRLGHMKQTSRPDTASPHYFLPHHCVTKPDSTTTKLRVVFDASAKTASNVSLNDILCKGPQTQDELFSILLRFRLPRFVFTADIEKMYRQVLLDEADQGYQLILWRENPTEPIKLYKLCTVTYGVTSAPFLATKCLQLLAEAEKMKFPLGSEVLRRDFYVDDVMTGSNSLVEAKEAQRQLKQLLQSAEFNLRKWCSNHPQLLQGIPKEDIAVELNFNEDIEEHIKTLGLIWLPKSGERITKRSVLADTARIFDPLGFVNPVTVTAKIFMQKLWSLKMDWDAALPTEMHNNWLKFREGLKSLKDINIPRHVCSTHQHKPIQIHAFSDASERAYGAAVYIRSLSQDGIVIVRLLCAKSKVAPIKTTTLPRLELCAAKLSAQLVQRVVKDMKLQSQRIYYWTDSEIVLAWINSESSSFHTFVANRVAAIQRLTNTEQWRHVRSSENPADIVSRGIPAEKLQNCNIWFYGPPFLHGSEQNWPVQYSKKDIDLERKKSKIVLTTSREYSPFSNFINHGNSIKKLQRIMAYVLRFTHNARQQLEDRRNKSALSIQELHEALLIILKEIQQEGFKEDISQLKNTGTISNTSSLNSLSPFLDEKGVVRVGGRLEHADLSYDAKHPILLPYSHPITKLLMTDIHNSNLHAGPQTLLAMTRQRFWPIRGKTIARSIVQNCVRCNRAKPKLMTQLMGNLPAARVQPARPFVNSGVDFCGPIWTHFKVRGKRPQKSYIAVFCCFATKAIHLEVVSDLTTEGFLGALKRFIARRGHCVSLFCDNATNFVGARNQLSELQDTLHSDKSQGKILSLCQEKGIKFQFIPPRAPHFGGLWEAAVKSAKSLLQRGIASASLTYEELTTVTTEIEAILNSRPITPLSSNPNDLTALTPGHFLIGEPLTSRVDPQSTSQQLGLATRWKLVSHIKQEFWRDGYMNTN